MATLTQKSARKLLHAALDKGIAAASDFNMFIHFESDPDQPDLPLLWELEDIDRVPDRHPNGFAKVDSDKVLEAAAVAFNDTRKVDTVRAYLVSLQAYLDGMLDPDRIKMMTDPTLDDGYLNACRAIDEWRRLAAQVSEDLSAK